MLQTCGGHFHIRHVHRVRHNIERGVERRWCRSHLNRPWPVKVHNITYGSSILIVPICLSILAVPICHFKSRFRSDLVLATLKFLTYLYFLLKWIRSVIIQSCCPTCLFLFSLNVLCSSQARNVNVFNCQVLQSVFVSLSHLFSFNGVFHLFNCVRNVFIT